MKPTVSGLAEGARVRAEKTSRSTPYPTTWTGALAPAYSRECFVNELAQITASASANEPSASP